MKLKKPVIALIIAVSLMVGSVIGAAASGKVQTITALLSPDITVKMDGEVRSFQDANGKTVYPIAYNGTTYLPIRAMANLLGLSVDWDQATRTASLNEPNGVDLIETLKAYQTSTYCGQYVNKSTTQISGYDVSHYLKLSSERVYRKGDISFNLMGKYNTLTFKVYSNNEGTFRVLGDNETVLFEKEMTGGAVAQDVTVNLNHTTQLTFQYEIPSWDYITMYVFDARLFT